MKLTFKTKHFVLAIITILLVFSCATTSYERKYEKEKIPSIPYIIQDDLDFGEADENESYKYIFLRLYNPIYSNPLYTANILKGCIAVSDVTRYELSHASINTSLEDDFYGLTFAGNSQFVPESCVDISTNKYMANCNPTFSEQFTYAIRVTEEEYDFVKDTIHFYSNNPNVTYAVIQNFKIAGYAVRRKFFTQKNHQQIGTNKYPKLKKAKYQTFEDFQQLENNFVCSTLIAYILYNSIPSLHEWFNENNINYNYITVTDLPYIPGVVPLFYSTWENYDLAADLFVQDHPEFKQYLNQ